jgi:hypothetical protein
LVDKNKWKWNKILEYYFSVFNSLLSKYQLLYVVKRVSRIIACIIYWQLMYVVCWKFNLMYATWLISQINSTNCKIITDFGMGVKIKLQILWNIAQSMGSDWWAFTIFYRKQQSNNQICFFIKSSLPKKKKISEYVITILLNVNYS